MDNAHMIYECWKQAAWLDPRLKELLCNLSEQEIVDSFSCELEFGTAGLRGIIGVGTNRMNVHTVGRATQGLAAVILRNGEESRQRGVVIGYDSRAFSAEFALRAALVLCANGIRAFLYPTLTPVPLVSYGVRKLGCIAGIMITASHNPPQYNGYKVYWQDGCQLPPFEADEVMDEIENIPFGSERIMTAEQAAENRLLYRVPDDLIENYFAELAKVSPVSNIFSSVPDFRVVYTPLHGTGNIPVRQALKNAGLENLVLVEEQCQPDPKFSTTPTPNPEDPRAFAMALHVAQTNNAHLIFGTDPDCDRVAVMAKNAQGEFAPISGNQLGCLILDYLLTNLQHHLPQNAAVIKTIVTTQLATAIAQDHGCTMLDVLTGFKFIGELMTEWEKHGQHTYIFGFEESCGYLAGTHARDKDGVIGSQLACECAAYHHSQGKTLWQALEELFEKYGYYAEKTLSIAFSGIQATSQMAEMMQKLRSNPPSILADIKILAVRDYLSCKRTDAAGNVTPLTLPQSDVLYYELEGGHWVCVRPSGTEPKCKIYLAVRGQSASDASSLIQALEGTMKDLCK